MRSFLDKIQPQDRVLVIGETSGSIRESMLDALSNKCKMRE